MSTLVGLKARVLTVEQLGYTPRAWMLSRREVAVLAHFAEGYQTREIASKLRIAPGTVEVHARSIRDKLGVASMLLAVRAALEAGVLYTVDRKPNLPNV